jgi:hypothetical protein
MLWLFPKGESAPILWPLPCSLQGLPRAPLPSPPPPAAITRTR